MALNLWLLIGGTLTLVILGGGIGYLIYLGVRPKKIVWNARVWQLSEGVQPPIKNKKGHIISDIQLNDLRPFTKDIIQRVEKKGGATYYELQKLGKSVPAVTSDVVDYWGPKDRTVDVLYHDDSCTLLTKGYDKTIGKRIYRPLPHSRINQIKTEIVLRKDRLKDTKSVLEAITPWVIFGIGIIGLIGFAYVLGNAWVEASENIKEGQIKGGEAHLEASKVFRESLLAMGELMNVSLTRTGILANQAVKVNASAPGVIK